jgi:hypothetical protein
MKMHSFLLATNWARDIEYRITRDCLFELHLRIRLLQMMPVNLFSSGIQDSFICAAQGS